MDQSIYFTRQKLRRGLDIHNYFWLFFGQNFRVIELWEQFLSEIPSSLEHFSSSSIVSNSSTMQTSGVSSPLCVITNFLRDFLT